MDCAQLCRQSENHHGVAKDPADRTGKVQSGADNFESFARTSGSEGGLPSNSSELAAQDLDHAEPRGPAPRMEFSMRLYKKQHPDRDDSKSHHHPDV